MKVLVVCVPQSGHLNPLLPLAGALVAQGDSVVVATGVDPGAAIARSGAQFRPAGGTETSWFETLNASVRGTPGDGLSPERINYYFVPRLFAEIAAGDMIDDVIACGTELEPDLVLFETYAFAGPLAAAVLGAPGVHHLINPILPHEVMELANDAVSPLWRSFGHDAPGYGGVYCGSTIEVSPPSLEVLQVPSGARLALRPAALPTRETVRSNPPLVYVTIGTFFPNPDVFRTVLAGIGTENVEVVVTVGPEMDPTLDRFSACKHSGGAFHPSSRSAPTVLGGRPSRRFWNDVRLAGSRRPAGGRSSRGGQFHQRRPSPEGRSRTGALAR
jgi:hypothetical protein